MDLRTYNLPSGLRKYDFAEVDETKFQGVKRLGELFFCILGMKKATCTKLHYWCLSIRMDLRIEKSYLDEVA
jgi:hypothetical protein